VKLQISNATKSFGSQQVLDKAFLQVKGNEKIALVGRNGCGKTTLLKIIAGQEDLDSGERIVPNATRIGYLNQITFLDENISVLENFKNVFEPLRQLENSSKSRSSF